VRGGRERARGRGRRGCGAKTGDSADQYSGKARTRKETGNARVRLCPSEAPVRTGSGAPVGARRPIGGLREGEPWHGLGETHLWVFLGKTRGAGARRKKASDGSLRGS
jgi:hypothetical protein